MNDYKKAESELMKLVRSGRKNAYRIAKRCVELFNESDDYADAIGIPADDVVDHINAMFLKDIAVDLEDLIVLLKRYPEEPQWDRPLLDLLEQAHREIKHERGPSTVTRKRITKAEFEQMESELKDAEYAINREREATQRALDERDAERRKVRELENEISMLRGRIQELERLANVAAA